MVRVTALTSGRNVPSARFRVRQHIRELREHGVNVKEYPSAVDKHRRMPGWPQSARPALAGPLFVLWQLFKLCLRAPGLVASRRADVTWVQREFLPGLLTLESMIGRPLVLDVDDAIWLGTPSGRTVARYLARRAEVVVAGNEFLAAWFRGVGARVETVPTSVDCATYRPTNTRRGKRQVTLGWIGTPDNLTYLESLEPVFARFLADRPTVRLLVVSRAPAVMPSIAPGQLQFRRWAAAEESEAIGEMDIGLMPLTDTEWGRGKCAFKMLQYMACEVPVLVSPVGVNAKILRLGNVGVGAADPQEWLEALHWMVDHPGRAREMGVEGRKVVLQHFESRQIAKELARVFAQTVARRSSG